MECKRVRVEKDHDSLMAQTACIPVLVCSMIRLAND
jgi:hypothetical protein